MIYLLDANVLIEAHETYYPIDRVPQFWEWIHSMAEKDRIKMPLEIYNEIAGSTGDLKDWISESTTKKALVLKEGPNPVLVRQVLDLGYADNLTDSELEKIGQDGFLIAYALADHNGRTVVTKETPRPTAERANRKIPDVCDSLGVNWMRDFDMFKLLKFTTARR